MGKKRGLPEIIAYAIKLLFIDFPSLLLQFFLLRKKFIKGLREGLSDLPRDLRREITWKAKEALKMKNIVRRILKGVKKRQKWGNWRGF